MRPNRLPIIRGAEAAECGLVCMTMIAKFHGHEVDLNGMRQRFALSISGATLRSIMDLSDQLGFSSRALKADLDSLRKVQTPAIMHWDLNHFVVLKNVSNKTITIHDPARGVRTLSIEEASKHFTGVVLEVSPAKNFTKLSAREPTYIKSLWSNIEGIWLALIQVVALSLALQIAVFAAPFYLQLIVDQAIQTGDADLVGVLAVGFGAVLIIQISITALRAWALQSIGLLVGLQMTGNVVRHLMRLKTSYFEKRHVGDILSRIGSVGPIRDAITAGVIATLIDGAMAIIAAVILFVYSPILAFIVLGGLTLSIVLTYALYPFQRARTEEQIHASAKEQTHMIESVRASTTIKLMGREAERESVWKNHFTDVTNATFSVSKYQIGMNAAQGLLTGLLTIVVVFQAAKMILAGTGFSIGMLFAFMSYRQTLTDRVLALINQVIAFRYLSLHLDRVGDVIHAEPDTYENAAPLSNAPLGAISVQNLSFQYGVADRVIFENVSFDISPGECVALTGNSGGGKTTLLKLLLGLYEPTMGRIELDGKLANSNLWQAWRSHVGVVAQDDQLLSGTIADNIAFFDPEQDMHRIQEAAKAARVHDDIIQMPMHYLSLVGDMGSSLSGGQRQRVLLARALYRKPSILFLDEGTANLDPETEIQIADLVDQLPITRVIVAHRPALIQRADTVYRVGEGRVQKGASKLKDGRKFAAEATPLKT